MHSRGKGGVERKTSGAEGEREKLDQGLLRSVRGEPTSGGEGVTHTHTEGVDFWETEPKFLP